MLSKEVSRPEIEPRSPRPMAITLPLILEKVYVFSSFFSEKYDTMFNIFSVRTYISTYDKNQEYSPHSVLLFVELEIPGIDPKHTRLNARKWCSLKGKKPRGLF